MVTEYGLVRQSLRRHVAPNPVSPKSHWNRSARFVSERALTGKPSAGTAGSGFSSAEWPQGMEPAPISGAAGPHRDAEG